jgi:hypothetical protein
MTRTLHYEADAGRGRRYACNMRWCVQAGDTVLYRGPYWRAAMIARGARLTFGEIGRV